MCDGNEKKSGDYYYDDDDDDDDNDIHLQLDCLSQNRHALYMKSMVDRYQEAMNN